MRAEIINPFLAATLDVFSTMLSWELVRGPLTFKPDCNSQFDVTGVIELMGKCRGVITLGLDSAAAIEATATLSGERPTEINAEVVDAIGEVTNMIAGSAKSQIEATDLRIGLPFVIQGKNTPINFQADATWMTLPFESTFGPIGVDIALAHEATTI